MIIKLKSRDGQELQVITETDDPDEYVTPRYSDELLGYILADELRTSHGFYGHLIEPTYTNNLDLYAGCSKLVGFELIEANPVPTPSKLPPLALS